MKLSKSTYEAQNSNINQGKINALKAYKILKLNPSYFWMHEKPCQHPYHSKITYNNYEKGQDDQNTGKTKETTTTVTIM